MFNIEEELKKLPDKPGVYIMHDKDDKIIYVGKAVSLKNRVRQYFRKTNKTKRIENMVSLIDHFEYIITDNEAEALILECNLIKKNMPKFNVLLKDDKTYPYIKIEIAEEYPNIYITRKIKNDNAKYFGPYANSGNAKQMIDFIKEKFKIRQCKNFKYKDRPCLNYHIKKCSGPCMGYISKEEYKEQINQIINILDGKVDNVIKEMKEEMNKAANNMEFEKAAYIRDKIMAVESIKNQKQKVSNISENDIDVIGIAKNEVQVCVEVFFVRKSKMIGREHYFFDNMVDETDKNILSEFIKLYYMGKNNLPNKIMFKEEIEDKKLIEELLTQIAERRVELKNPQKGEKLRLVEMAEKNAFITLQNKVKEKYDVMSELKQVLKLEVLPRKIECYDISNISGTNIVAGMCVMQDGIIKKNLSRRFKIKTVFNQDDPKCMAEVIERRLKQTIEKQNSGFGNLPNIIFVDGGITQIKAAKSVLKKYNLENKISVFGMVKNEKHQTRALINSERKELELSEKLMNIITMFQDSVHDTAIEYHKKLRDKSMSFSELDEIKGIGMTKKVLLLKQFGSVENIKKASIDDLIKVKGITKKLAEEIINSLK